MVPTSYLFLQILPLNWRREELRGSDEVFIVKEGSILKIIPRRKPDITKYLDSVDLGVDSIEE